MKNYICTGERIQVVAPSGGITAGSVILIGSKVAVATTSAIETETAVAQTEGVFEVAKAVGAISQGDSLFFDNTAKNLTKTVSGNTLAGYAYKSALSADTTVQLVLTDNTNSVPTFTTVAAQVDSVATTAAGAVIDLNLLLAKLRASGIMTA